MKNAIQISLVDDHNLLRSGLANLIGSLGYTVLSESNNGQQFIDELDMNNLPDLVLMDISMPVMDGFETTLWIRKNCPLISVIALSMYDDESSIIRMIKNGAKGYILKDSNPAELKQAIESVLAKGFYYSDLVSGRLIRSIQDEDEDDKVNRKMATGLNDKHIEFLKHAATEMTYKEIAIQMHLSPRTIDGYRDELFDKLNVRSRVGLVLFAIKNGLIHLH